MEIGAEDGGAMLAEKNDEGENEKEGEEEVDAEVFAMGHEESLQFTVFGLKQDSRVTGGEGDDWRPVKRSANAEFAENAEGAEKSRETPHPENRRVRHPTGNDIA
jgi:hypothetical protein